MYTYIYMVFQLYLSIYICMFQEKTTLSIKKSHLSTESILEIHTAARSYFLTGNDVTLDIHRLRIKNLIFFNLKEKNLKFDVTSGLRMNMSQPEVTQFRYIVTSVSNAKNFEPQAHSFWFEIRRRYFSVENIFL